MRTPHILSAATQRFRRKTSPGRTKREGSSLLPSSRADEPFPNASLMYMAATLPKAAALGKGSEYLDGGLQRNRTHQRRLISHNNCWNLVAEGEQGPGGRQVSAHKSLRKARVDGSAVAPGCGPPGNPRNASAPAAASWGLAPPFLSALETSACGRFGACAVKRTEAGGRRLRLRSRRKRPSDVPPRGSGGCGLAAAVGNEDAPRNGTNPTQSRGPCARLRRCPCPGRP